MSKHEIKFLGQVIAGASISFLLIVILANCAGFSLTTKSSKCEDIKYQNTYLCKAASQLNVKLEDVNKGLVVFNVTMISQGKYTKSQALGMLDEIEQYIQTYKGILLLEDGKIDQEEFLTFARFFVDAEDYFMEYPGLFELTDGFELHFKDNGLLDSVISLGDFELIQMAIDHHRKKIAFYFPKKINQSVKLDS